MSESAGSKQLSELSLEALVACHECDLLMRKPPLADGERAECPRCGFELYSHNHHVVRRSLALVIAALSEGFNDVFVQPKAAVVA